MSNFCIDLETGNAFVYEVTLETIYLQGRFGAVPRINDMTKTRPQFFHTPMQITEPEKLVTELRKLADKLEAEL